MRVGSHREGRRSGQKLGVPRHRTQSSDSADAQERAIETSERQEARRAIDAGLAEYEDDLTEEDSCEVELECTDCGVQGDLATVYPEYEEPLCYYCYMNRLYSEESE